MKLFLMAWVVISFPLFSNAQPVDGAYKTVATPQGVATPPTYLQEHNVKYSKRVVRVIDPRQKVNKGLDWPRNNFSDVLYNAITRGEVTAYTDEFFSKRCSDSLFDSLHTSCEIVTISDPNNIYYTYDTLICSPVHPDEFYQKFMVVEDWIFDYERGVMEPRIIAIAPIYRKVIPNTNIDLGEQPLYWIKMDELRPYIAQQEMFTTENKAARLTFDDFFQYRLFDSYVVKETNVFDYYIRDFDEFRDDGVSALLKSEEIDNNFFLFEHDLWQY